ncbi:hypothetical protein [Actinacidiphila yanglinensis]|uniref:hypothetical protein n=1 Tax=Actinacidiphila yanglinensis TaxID=310779 RepID=UPI001F1CCDBC|nr:hypothetical protein [Actinacidiphila yanglinensis]
MDLGLQPSADYLTSGLPPGVIAEVERLATELAALGDDSTKVGRPFDREGGLREFDILNGRVSSASSPSRATHASTSATSPSTAEAAGPECPTASFVAIERETL